MKQILTSHAFRISGRHQISCLWVTLKAIILDFFAVRSGCGGDLDELHQVVLQGCESSVTGDSAAQLACLCANLGLG